MATPSSTSSILEEHNYFLSTPNSASCIDDIFSESIYYSCDICEKSVFKEWRDLNNHISIEHPFISDNNMNCGKKFITCTCMFCGQKFISVENLAKHTDTFQCLETFQELKCSFDMLMFDLN